MNKRQMSEAYPVAAVLAAAGGFLDAYSYICRGHVFANAQTGNIVLLGISAFEHSWLDCVKYLLPILMFVLGVLISEEIRKHFAKSPIHWRQWVLLIEIPVLAAVGFIPCGSYDIAANILISFVCSLQVQSFRKVHSIAFATTMCTGNLRTASENMFRYCDTGEKRFLHNGLKIYGIIGFFVLGVIMGAVVSEAFGARAVLAAAVMLLAVFALMFIE